MALRPRLGVSRGDPAPTHPAPVVVVTGAQPPGRAALRRAVEAAGDGTVAVVATLRIFGSAWGFPNPGLMPNAAEKDAARRVVEATIEAIERAGGRADGQITATRNAAKVVAAVARRRGSSLVLVDLETSGGMRGLLAGDPVAEIRRRLRGADVQVEHVDSSRKGAR